MSVGNDIIAEEQTVTDKTEQAGIRSEDTPKINARVLRGGKKGRSNPPPYLYIYIKKYCLFS